MNSFLKYNRQVLDGSIIALISLVSHKLSMAQTKNLILQIKKLKQNDDKSGENPKGLFLSTKRKTKPSTKRSININILNKKISYKIWLPNSSVKVRRCVNICKSLVTTIGYGYMAPALLRRNRFATIPTILSLKRRSVFRCHLPSTEQQRNMSLLPFFYQILKGPQSSRKK